MRFAELIRAALSLPFRAARGLWRFLEPQLKVGRIPHGRTVLLLQLIAALTFVGYTLVKKDVRLPFSSKPYLVDVILPDAKGLNPTKEPAVGVAGVTAGKVVAVHVESDQARVTMRLDPEMKGKIFNDATAFVRPTSVLQTLIVNIQPGDPGSGALEDGKAIPAANTDAFVAVDDLTGVLDADTQAQVQVLVQEAARGLHGREPQIRAILAKLGDLTDEATPLAKALADRRRLLSRLTSHLNVLFGTLGERGDQLARTIELGDRTLEVSADREPELKVATRELAPTVHQAQRALSASRTLAEPLIPALDRLIPAARHVRPAASELKALAPALDRFVGSADGLVRVGARPARLFARGLSGQAERVRNDQIPALRELVDLVNLLFHYRNGIVQFAEGLSGVTSNNRNAGPFAQFSVINAELTPEGLGLKPKSARSHGGKPSRLATLLAEALERTCRDSNPTACMLRFKIPGLPPDPLLGGAKGPRG